MGGGGHTLSDVLLFTKDKMYLYKWSEGNPSEGLDVKAQCSCPVSEHTDVQSLREARMCLDSTRSQVQLRHLYETSLACLLIGGYGKRSALSAFTSVSEMLSLNLVMGKQSDQPECGIVLETTGQALEGVSVWVAGWLSVQSL